jgi:Domain of unknown function (DUF1707)
VTAGPGDQMAAAAAHRGGLRASHGDREHVIDTLKVAFVQGRLTKDEFDLRVGQTLASRTYAELADLTADIPAAQTGDQPLRTRARARARPPAKRAVISCACVIMATELISLLAVVTLRPAPFGLACAVLANLVGLPLAVGMIVDSWREKRSREQLPPRPAQCGPALAGDQDARLGDDLIRCDVRSDVRAGSQERSAKVGPWPIAQHGIGEYLAHRCGDRLIPLS